MWSCGLCELLWLRVIGCVEEGEDVNTGLYTIFFFQAEDGIRVLVRSRGLGDVYKRQE